VQNNSTNWQTGDENKTNLNQRRTGELKGYLCWISAVYNCLMMAKYKPTAIGRSDQSYKKRMDLVDMEIKQGIKQGEHTLSTSTIQLVQYHQEQAPSTP
jgi:hypothetical protein